MLRYQSHTQPLRGPGYEAPCWRHCPGAHPAACRVDMKQHCLLSQLACKQFLLWAMLIHCPTWLLSSQLGSKTALVCLQWCSSYVMSC